LFTQLRLGVEAVGAGDDEAADQRGGVLRETEVGAVENSVRLQVEIIRKCLDAIFSRENYRLAERPR
jgi:hypothetical protein